MKRLVAFVAVITLLLSQSPMVFAKDIPGMLAGGLGIVAGVPGGAIAGLQRGAINKGVEYGNAFSDTLGGGFIGKLVGFHGGLLVGAVTGGVTGVLSGGLHGLIDGYNHPLSVESISMDGDYLDYDPYDII